MVLRPQIDVNIKSNLSLIEPKGPGTVAIIGTAQWGPFNEIKTLTSLNEGIEYFKDDIDSTSEINLIKGLDLAYRNGAGIVYALRVGDGTEETSNVILDAGSTNVVTIYGKYKGRYGDNITATVTANGSGRDVKISDGVLVENYTNSGNGYTSNIELVSYINNNSNLVVTTCLTDDYLLDAVSETNLTGGIDGNNAVTAGNITTAFDNYLANEEFNILIVPGTTADSFHSTMVTKMNTRATNDDKFTVFVGGIAQDETIATATARTASGKRLAIVAPSCKYTHRITGNSIYLDGSYVACAYAGLLATMWPEKSPTHKILSTEGVMLDTTTLKKYYNNGEQEQLLSLGIVPISLISGSEMVVRGVTKHPTKTEVWFEQNIVGIVDYVHKQVIDTLNPFIGNPNLDRVRNVMAKNIDGILEQDMSDEIIESYQSTIVTLGSSPDTVNVAITIKPTFAVNFITVNLTIDNIST